MLGNTNVILNVSGFVSVLKAKNALMGQIRSLKKKSHFKGEKRLSLPFIFDFKNGLKIF